jgi:hypothetical protein
MKNSHFKLPYFYPNMIQKTKSIIICSAKRKSCNFLNYYPSIRVKKKRNLYQKYISLNHNLKLLKS